MSEWRDIETAPKDGTLVIVYKPGAAAKLRVKIDSWSTKANAWWRCRLTEQPTHWMPLPAPPEGETHE